MAAPWAKGFYQSAAWRKNSRAYLASVDGLCERCRSAGKLVPAVIVHHREHLTAESIRDPMMAMGWDNLEALCQECHNKEHFGNPRVREVRFNADGEIQWG